MNFQVGDKVKIEDILVANNNNRCTTYPLKIELGDVDLEFTEDGRYYVGSSVLLQLIERPKLPKIIELSDDKFESIIEDYKQDYQHRDVTSLLERLRKELFGDKK